MRLLCAIRRRIASDWMIYLLFPLAAVCLPWMVRDSGWFPGAEALTRAALWAALAAFVLSYSRLSSNIVWLLGWLAGMLYSVQFAADLMPPSYMLERDWQRVSAWLNELVSERRPNPDLPLSYSATFIVERAHDLYQRVWGWVVALRQGIPNTDNTVLQLSGCLLIWLLVFSLGYHLLRTRRGLAGLAPLGVVILASVSFTGVGTLQAQIYFAASLILWLWSRAGHMQLTWSQRSTHVAPQWRRHLLSTGFPVAGLVFCIALAMPYRSYDRAVYYFWEHMGHRLQTFYQKMDRAFAGRNALTIPKSGDDASEEASLRPHDIRGGVSASDRPLFMVRTSDPAPDASGQGAPKRYWRERTYDQYTGIGWETSPVERATFDSGRIWKEVGYPRQLLNQTYTLFEDRQLALNVNEPVVVDHRYTVLSRGAGDLAALAVGGSTYVVTSQVPDATVEELRRAEAAYSDWLAARYLALPEVPWRVRIMAERVVERAGATTRYDKARAIEEYLRGLTYDVDVPPPPGNADVVEYLLFTARRGYCDYSATAMVVMLRSVGVAARYASGYGQGTYDVEQGAWVVTGKNAHAWAEVYFPGYGWIEFEPTPSQGVFSRADTRPVAAPTPVATESIAPQPTVSAPRDSAPEPQPLDSIHTWSRNGRLLSNAAKGGLLVFLVGLIMVSPRLLIRPRPAPRELVWRAYGRLQLWGRLLGIVPQENLTPRESLQALQREIERQHARGEEIIESIGVVQSLYERARYSAQDLTVRDGDRAWQAWTILRGYLHRMLWARLGRPG